MNADSVKQVFNDVGVRVTLAVAGTVAAGAAVVVPSGKQVCKTRCKFLADGRPWCTAAYPNNCYANYNSIQVEAAALEIYGRPPQQLLPNERKCAEFRAGYKRWKGFVDNSIYSWTRKLPGHDNPIVNPYKGPRRLNRPKPEQQVEQELEAATKE